MLVGRSAERAALDRLMEGGRSGRSAALVLRGEPGVGKTALLGYAAVQAQDARVLRAVGIETETELAFAGLHQLLGRDLGCVDELPEPQAAALRGAFGMAAAGERTDPFLISLAVLSLLAELSEERPLLCLVDDAQWLDAPSATALLFAARRIEAEGLVIVFAVREGEERPFDAPGVPSIKIEALGEADARALLETHAGKGVAAAVRERLLADAAGNPLALLELPAGLTGEQLRGDEPLSNPLPIGSGLEGAYVARVRRLPDETQALLVVAAAEDSGELGTILRAATAHGIEREALEPAEREGLVIVVDSRLEFRHPLVRSAIYQ